ncbi:primosome assembly protein PriA [Wenjunlia vitaminophila]|uniref:Probable replication restart protein PriA n=1 Tax=Wenjunlia vitaminophila TaxID=76728 RepID=A0A0T6LXD0_WENVI|nr:primosomal protein N' [Wenjunlia vitaminophila]KRV50396.1 primosome assembly protein PriA [Wenjunlia vitaminophila]
MDSDKAPDERGPEQLALIRAAVRRSRPRARTAAAISDHLPVARVAVDKALSHLDRFYDYAVPAAMDADAVPGARVRVRFGGHVARGQAGRRAGGQLVDGFIVERLESSDYQGPLAPLSSVLSPEPVLSPELLRLARAVADRYAGTLADVLQLAVPPRHGRAEAADAPEPLPPPTAPEPGTWSRYPTGPAFLRALEGGGTPRAVWTALPGPHWPRELATAVVATLASGRGALVVVPDGRAAGRVDSALTGLLGAGRHVVLTADSGPQERYRRWLAVSRGAVRAVVGTRSAMFAPVRDLGLVAIWDDGDSSHSEPHAPQPHVREVLVLRATTEGAGFLVGGLGCTAEAAQLVAGRWALPLTAPRQVVRAAGPLVRTVEEADAARDAAARTARLPSLAWRVTRDGLTRGPVLVQVPRRGYVPRLSCQRCRTAARCAVCAGPLELRADDRVLHCGWCGRLEVAWHCLACGGTRLRAQVVGARRTADELGRAFPDVPVRTSGRAGPGGEGVLASVSDAPALVISTPGAEPVAEGGYAAALLLDGWVLLNRPDLRAGEEALRRWLAAAALVRPAADGGTVVVVAEPSLRPVQALVRWDPVGHAVRELSERAELGLPPVSRMASVTGTAAAVADVVATASLPPETSVLGPVPAPAADPAAPPLDRVLLRVPPGSGAALATALKAAQAVRLARGAEPVRVRIDPPDIG